MKSRYPMKPLREVLAPDAESIAVEPQSEYRIAGVYGFGRGAFEREAIHGADTKYAELFRLAEGWVVYSKLKAFEGAIAVVPAQLAGAHVSQEFPTFRTREGVDVAYLAHLCRWPDLWAKLAEDSRGVGARRERLHPDDFLATCVPMPDVDEQRRVAVYLNRVQQAVDSASAYRALAVQRLDALGASLASQPHISDEERAASGWRPWPLRRFMTEAEASTEVKSDTSYPNLGIYSFGRGVFAKPEIDGAVTSATRLNTVRAGQFIYSRLFAFEGAYAYVPEQFDGYFVSNEFPAFDVDSDLALAEFVAAAFRDPAVWVTLAFGSRGLGLRRQRVQVEALLDHQIWLPSVDEQRRIVGGLRRIDQLRRLSARSQALSNGLLSAAFNRAFTGLV